MPTIVVIVGIFLYIGFGGIVINYIIPEFFYAYRRGFTITFGFIFMLGWVWLVASLSIGSVKEGFKLFRFWIAVYGGLIVAVIPFVIFPHPATIILGVILGVAFGSYVATGKATWLDF